jgi:hypothetical protein
MVGGVSPRSVERAQKRKREDPTAHEKAKAGTLGKERRQQKRANGQQDRQERWSRLSPEERVREEQAHRDKHHRHGDLGGFKDILSESDGVVITEKDVKLLADLLGHLSSDNANERLAFADKAEEFRQRLGVSWKDLLTEPKELRFIPGERHSYWEPITANQ